MLTEVDTRTMYGTGDEVTLWMDTDAQVYQVSVTGHAPIICLTRDRAVAAFNHPYVYMPQEGSESPPNGTEEVSPTEEPYDFAGVATAPENPESMSPEDLTRRTGAVLHELRTCLLAMNAGDFRWSISIISDVIAAVDQTRIEREQGKPYDQEQDGPDIPF